MKTFVLARRPHGKIRKAVERAVLTICKKAIFRAGEIAEQIRLVKTVQIDDEVELSSPHVRHQSKYFGDRLCLVAVTQRDAVHNDLIVRHTGHSHYFGSGFANEDRDLRI